MFCPRGKGKKSEKSSEELKSSILKIARKHFADFGYQGASLKEIAKESGVASSLMNYHYKDKDGLFTQVMELFATARMEGINRILNEPKSADDMRVRLELFVEEMIVSVMDDPDSFQILDSEVKRGNPLILKLFENTMLKAFKNVVQFFTKAQEMGLIRKELDPLIVATLLFTSACDASRKDVLARRFFDVSFAQVEWRKKFAQHVVTLFMSGVMQ